MKKSLLCILVVVNLAGCVGLRPGYETPTVTVSSFKALPSEGALPAFEIGLRVINPNPEALELAGVSYTVSVEGFDIIKGVANELPVIEGYGEGEFKLTASASLLAGVRLFSELMNTPKDRFDYEFEAKLDPGLLFPSIRITDSGNFSLGTTGSQ